MKQKISICIFLKNLLLGWRTWFSLVLLVMGLYLLSHFPWDSLIHGAALAEGLMILAPIIFSSGVAVSMLMFSVRNALSMSTTRKPCHLAM